MDGWPTNRDFGQNNDRFGPISTQDTDAMKLLRLGITIVAVIFVVVLGWFGVKQYNCQKRNAAFSRLIASIKHDAHEQLRIGTKKADVTRFYDTHNIPFEFGLEPGTDRGYEARGTLITIGGCAPLGCGTDNALIGVAVKLDAEGTVIGEPQVVDMYTSCV